MDKILAAVFVVVVLVVVGALGWAGRSASCAWTWSGAYETKVDLGGCKVKVGDKWLPEKVVREIQ